MLTDIRSTQRHVRKLIRSVCRREVKEYGFPHRSTAAKNEVIDGIIPR